MAFTMDNTEGFSAADLTRMNTISAAIRFANAELHGNVIEEAVGQSFDPELSDAENEHWALSRLGRA